MATQKEADLTEKLAVRDQDLTRLKDIEGKQDDRLILINISFPSCSPALGYDRETGKSNRKNSNSANSSR